MLSYLRRQLRDLLELFMLPALSLLFSWRTCFKLFKWLCRFDFFYKDHVDSAFENALNLGVLSLEDSREWRQKIRLTRLIDLADFYLTLFKGDKWLAKNVKMQGEWPAHGAGFLCTFHWGGGMWAIRSARISGLTPHMMLARFDPVHFKNQPVLLHYAKYRTAVVERETGFQTIDPKQARPAIQKALEIGNQVMVVMDVPPDAVRSTVPVMIVDRQVRMPIGLLKMAVQSKVPVTIFSMGYDFETGVRLLSVRNLPLIEDSLQLATTVYDELDSLIQRDPALWHFWAQMPRFMA